MDQGLRELYRNCCSGNDRDCYAAFVSYRRAGITAQEMPREVLYGKTQYQLMHQAPIDFRSQLHSLGPAAWSGFNAIRFNDQVSISIQGHRGAYCKPREDSPDPNHYTQWEIYFEAPLTEKHFVITGGPGLEQLTTPGLEIVLEHDEDIIRIEELREALADPLARVEISTLDNPQFQFVQYYIRRVNPDFAAGGVYYGLPHQKAFSVYDPGIAPYAPAAIVQDIFDFLRARFGLAGEI